MGVVQEDSSSLIRSPVAAEGRLYDLEGRRNYFLGSCFSFFFLQLLQMKISSEQRAVRAFLSSLFQGKVYFGRVHLGRVLVESYLGRLSYFYWLVALGTP